MTTYKALGGQSVDTTDECDRPRAEYQISPVDILEVNLHIVHVTILLDQSKSASLVAIPRERTYEWQAAAEHQVRLHSISLGPGWASRR